MPEAESSAQLPKKKKKEKKEKKDKGKKANAENKEKKNKKRERSKSKDAPDVVQRIRKSKWDPYTGEPPALPAATVEAPESSPEADIEQFATVNNETLPTLNDEEMMERTLLLEPLPLDCKARELLEFLNGAVLAVTGNTLLQANRPEAPIFSCGLIEEERDDDAKVKVADLKFRTPHGANVGMRLSGLEYSGEQLRIKRPAGFVLPEDGVDPSTDIDLKSVTMVKLIGEKNHGSIFNLPDELTEEITHDLLSQFGKLKSLKLIKDAATDKIKGYGFFEYVDLADTDLAVRALNGFVCGQRVIVVRWMGPPLPSQVQAPPSCVQHPNSITQRIIANKMIAAHVKQGVVSGAKPSTIVQLINVVRKVDLGDDEEYQDIMEQVRSEASKYGKVNQVVIPRLGKDSSQVGCSGIGKIFVEFDHLTSARKFQHITNGRKFDDRTTCAAFYPEEDFKKGTYNLLVGEKDMESAQPSDATQQDMQAAQVATGAPDVAQTLQVEPIVVLDDD